jgi:hypothetical protein
MLLKRSPLLLRSMGLVEPSVAFFGGFLCDLDILWFEIPSILWRYLIEEIVLHLYMYKRRLDQFSGIKLKSCRDLYVFWLRGRACVAPGPKKGQGRSLLGWINPCALLSAGRQNGANRRRQVRQGHALQPDTPWAGQPGQEQALAAKEDVFHALDPFQVVFHRRLE